MTNRKTKIHRKKQTQQYWRFSYKKWRFRVLVDKVLFLRFLKNIHGRFWGITAFFGMVLGFTICFAIRPEMLDISTAFSEFGNDIRTAPYFTGTVLFTAYGLWRWRKYLSRTWKRSMPVTGLMMLTVLGLYLVALMPLGWKPTPYYIHMFGVSLAGISMLATVVLDGLLSKTASGNKGVFWRFWRTVSLIAILSGGWLTLGSTELLAWYHVSLLGESLLLLGYFMWIWVKTYHGEGRRTLLSKFLKDFVLVN